MKELLEYRVFLVNRLGQAAREFCEAGASTEPSVRAASGRSVHFVAALVRNVNRLVYAVRVRRTLEEQNPLFENFDPDEWMAAHYDETESIKTILDEFKTDVDALCTLLNHLPLEAWSRESRHETIGDGLPLQLWVERGLANIEEHLVEIKSRP